MNGVARFGQVLRKRTHLLFAGADVLAAARAGQGIFSHASLVPAPLDRWLGSVGRAEDVANGYTIRSISSSPGGHTLIVYRSLGIDRCFGLGRNEFGQLGVGYNSQESTRGLVETFGECEEVLDVHTSFQTSFIRSQKAGEGVLHTFGSAQRGIAGFGQCASRDVAQIQASPRPVRVRLPENDVAQIATGFEHVLLLTRGGIIRYASVSAVLIRERTGGKHIFAMGCSTDGQCGVPELRDVWNPTQIGLPTQVMSEGVACIRAGGDTSALITRQGNLWTWGNSEYGQAGHGHKADQLVTPTVVSRDVFPSDVLDFRIGGSSSILLDDEGHVHTVGYGALGRGQDRLSSLTFGRVAIDEPVRSVMAGPGMFAAITDEEKPSLYVWGTNGSHGRLGINSCRTTSDNGWSFFEPAHTPVRVELPMKALGFEDSQTWDIGHVACGVDNLWVTIETETSE